MNTMKSAKGSRTSPAAPYDLNSSCHKTVPHDTNCNGDETPLSVARTAEVFKPRLKSVACFSADYSSARRRFREETEMPGPRLPRLPVCCEAALPGQRRVRPPGAACTSAAG